MKSTTTRNLLRRRAFLLTLFFLSVALSLQAQMLFSENMTMKIDSSKPVQGTFSTMVNFKTEHENLFEFKTFSNLNILIGSKRVINLMGRFEFTTYGSKITVDEGDLHAEYRYLLRRSPVGRHARLDSQSIDRCAGALSSDPYRAQPDVPHHRAFL